MDEKKGERGYNLYWQKGLIHLQFMNHVPDNMIALVSAVNVCELGAVPGRLLKLPILSAGSVSTSSNEETGAVPRTLTVQPQPLASLVARQLSDREIDPTFRRSMEVAQVLARSLLH